MMLMGILSLHLKQYRHRRIFYSMMVRLEHVAEITLASLGMKQMMTKLEQSLLYLLQYGVLVWGQVQNLLSL